jgi:hypothetical protein
MRPKILSDGTIVKHCHICKEEISIHPEDTDGVHTCGTHYTISRNNSTKCGIKIKYYPTEKKCSTCGKLLPIDEFHTETRYDDNHAYECKRCVSLFRAPRNRTKLHVGEHPDFTEKADFKNVLSYLIHVSRNGSYRDQILSEAIDAVKESIA